MRLTCKRKESCDCSYCVARDASSHSLSEQLKHIMMLRTVAYPGGVFRVLEHPLSLRDTGRSYLDIQAYINNYCLKPLFGDKNAKSSFVLTS